MALGKRDWKLTSGGEAFFYGISLPEIIICLLWFFIGICIGHSCIVEHRRPDLTLAGLSYRAGRLFNNYSPKAKLILFNNINWAWGGKHSFERTKKSAKVNHSTINHADKAPWSLFLPSKSSALGYWCIFKTVLLWNFGKTPSSRQRFCSALRVHLVRLLTS